MYDYVTGALMGSDLIHTKAEPGGRKGEPYCAPLTLRHSYFDFISREIVYI